MLTDNRADYRPQDWFLIACDGDLVLKLAHDLLIGEDERGQTVLSPARENALLGITSENGRLTLQALAMEWTFSEGGGLSVQHLTFTQGISVKLVFPNSTLIITPDFKAGSRVSVDREIELKPTETPTVTLSRVNEPITLIDPPLEEFTESTPAGRDALGEDISMEEVTALLEAANETDSDEVFVRLDHDVPDEVVPAYLMTDAATLDASTNDDIPILTHTVREISPLPEPAAADAAETAPAESQPAIRASAITDPATNGPVTAAPVSASVVGLPHRHRVLGGLIAATALLAPMVYFVNDARDLGVNFPLSQYRSESDTTAAGEFITATVTADPEEILPAGELLTQSDEPLKAAYETETSEVQIPADEISTPALPSPGPALATGAAAELSESDRLLIQSLLAEAQAFYDAGAIVTPVQSNAVSNLTQLLHMDPTNEEGLRLMYLSAVRLIDEAQLAHEAGDHYLARNLVEDVLGFHPEFRDARNLLDSWTRAPGS